jgi:hypothetical protein
MKKLELGHAVCLARGANVPFEAVLPTKSERVRPLADRRSAIHSKEIQSSTKAGPAPNDGAGVIVCCYSSGRDAGP